MVYLIAIFIFSLGVILGLGLPDIDSTIRFLVHRSIVTHNFLWPLIPFWVAKGHRTSPTRVRLFAMGLAIALAAHFSFDLFPRGWQGFALIHIPVYGRTEALFSWLWFALSLLVCVYIAISLIKQLFDVALLTAGSLVVFALMGSAEPFGRPLAALAVAIIVVSAVDWPKLMRRVRR